MKLDALTSSENSVRQCGGKPSPLVWCAFEDDFKSDKSTSEVTVPHVISLFCY